MTCRSTCPPGPGWPWSGRAVRASRRWPASCCGSGSSPTGASSSAGPRCTDMTVDDARRLVTVVAQHDHLFDTTLATTCPSATTDADDDRIWAACADADVAETIRARPDGLDERVGEDGSHLSGGERQRVMIARALLTDAPILVLDEATAHLDAPTARTVLERVFERRAGPDHHRDHPRRRPDPRGRPGAAGRGRLDHRRREPGLTAQSPRTAAARSRSSSSTGSHVMRGSRPNQRC